ETAALFPGLPVVANERCGTWYVDPQIASAVSVYFKSTDGHNGNWKFSLRRANTQLLEALGTHRGCLIVDSTRRGKSMPDAFSKTIPIWCAVWTRAIARQRGMPTWDTKLYTPPQVVSRSEHSQIEQLIDTFVAALLGSGIDIARHTHAIDRPLRAIWVTRDQALHMPPDFSDAPFTPVVCVSASSIVKQRVEASGENSPFVYIQGSADDHETWAQGLTPRLFWKHKTRLLAHSNMCEDVAKEVVAKERERGTSGHDGTDSEGGARSSVVGKTCVSVGDRVSGRPPECWQQFDAIINCGSPEYEQNRDPALEQR
ncbi:tRNA A64-2'-O-ribosylphosphate transferase, partial [Linderina pennispora]